MGQRVVAFDPLGAEKPGVQFGDPAPLLSTRLRHERGTRQRGRDPGDGVGKKREFGGYGLHPVPECVDCELFIPESLSIESKPSQRGPGEIVRVRFAGLDLDVLSAMPVAGRLWHRHGRFGYGCHGHFAFLANRLMRYPGARSCVGSVATMGHKQKGPCPFGAEAFFAELESWATRMVMTPESS